MSALRFTSLGSGSRGNALLVEAGATRVLVDNGFSLREARRRLESREVDITTITAVLVTHEHSDHASGVVTLAARHDIPVFLTAGTRLAMDARGQFDGVKVDCRRIVRGTAFALGSLSVLPVRVPHDAREPCQFVFESGGARLGVLTDIGSLTPQVVAAYRDCDALFLECNHDVRMLADGPYPPSLKARVGGEFGHLSNLQAAQLLAQVDRTRLRHLVVGHLSEQNNEPRLAREAAAAVLDRPLEDIIAASQSSGHDWLGLDHLNARPAGGTGA